MYNSRYKNASEQELFYLAILTICLKQLTEVLIPVPDPKSYL